MIRLPSIASASALGILTIPLGACAGYQHYQPAPLAPLDEARAHSARRLDDPALAHLLAAHGVPANDTAWDARQLAIAALYFRADVAEAQHALAAARAGEIAAGVRPYPSVTATASRAAQADGGHSTPWSFSLVTGFTFERGGKRNARIARARAATFAARLRLESTAWREAQDARASSVAALGSDADLRDARAEMAQLRTVLDLIRARYAEGQIGRADLARTVADVQTSAVAATLAQRARSDARAALARALAVPRHEVDRLVLRPDPRSACVAADSLPIDTLDVLALRMRPDVGVALADYTVAESDLRVQIAQQYPDVALGPGIGWAQGVGQWMLSLGLPGLPVDRARGPIAGATARRAVQAERVRVVQDAALAAVDSSVAACRSANREIAATDSLVAASHERLVLTRAAYQRGEIGRTAVALAELEWMRAGRARHQAVQRRRAAGVGLEDAAGMWFSGAPIDWQDLIMPDDAMNPRKDRVDGSE